MDEKDKLIHTLESKVTELETQNKKLLDKIVELHMQIVRIQEENL